MSAMATMTERWRRNMKNDEQYLGQVQSYSFMTCDTAVVYVQNT